MGKRGPPPKPSSLKKLEGTYRPDRAARSEFKPPEGAPACPDYLDSVARAVWDEHAPELVKAKILTIVDGPLFEAFCVNVAMARRLQAMAQDEPTVTGSQGQIKLNPAAGEARQHWALARQLGAEFGLSPSSRSRIGTVGRDDQRDATADFLFGPLRVVNGGAE
jgi:P27 family predicted phage terminase small subunit